jgi:polysaccharide biosynthesis protein PslG
LNDARSTFVVALFVLASLLGACCQSFAAPATKPVVTGPDLPAGLGVNIHFTDPKPGEIEMLAAAGCGIVRMDFVWSDTEKQPGVYDFAAYERLLAALDKHGIRALFILDYVNAHYDDNQSPHTDVGRAAMAKWAATAATHFQGRGVLWEMYNEPNITPFWRPTPNVDHYAKLALEVGKAIRAAAPGETYVGPATSGIDLPFLESCFKAGLLEYWDAVTVHPYRQTHPETVAEDYRNLRLLIAKYAPAGKQVPILSGEWGYSSVWSGMTDEKQGKLLPRQWLTNIANDVPVSIWYDWHDDGPDPKEPEHHFGTVAHPHYAGREPVYDAKPVYLAAKTLTKQLRGYRFNKRLSLVDPEDYLLLFTKGDDANDVKLVAWTTAATSRPSRLPASPGAFAVTSHTGVPLADLVADDTGMILTLTDAPQYLAPLGRNELLHVAAAWDRLPAEIVTPANPQLRVAVPVKNPLAVSLGVSLDARPLDRVAPASLSQRLHADARLSDQGNPIELRAGDARQFDISVRATRATSRVPIRARLGVDRLAVMVAQETVVVVTNPLSATALPRAGKLLPVRIENPSGEAFHGSLLVRDGTGGNGTVEPLELKAGQTDVTLVRSAPPVEPDGAYSVRLAMSSADGAGDALPPRRLKPIDQHASALELHPDGDDKIKSEQSHAQADAPAGLPVDYGKAIRIDYRFDPGWKFVRFAPKTPELQAIDGKPSAIGMWVHGDGSGNFARMRFVDSTNQTFQPDGPPLTFTGWRYVEFPLDGRGAGHWGGAKDGVVHYPIRLDTLFLLDNATRRETKGSVYVTAPTLVYDLEEKPE